MAFGDLTPAHVVLHRAALGDLVGEIVLSLPVVDGVVNEQWASMVKDYAAQAASGLSVRCVTAPLMRVDDLGLMDLIDVRLDALGYDSFYELRGEWFPMAALDRATKQRASPDPSVFAASDP